MNNPEHDPVSPGDASAWRSFNGQRYNLCFTYVLVCFYARVARVLHGLVAVVFCQADRLAYHFCRPCLVLWHV